MITKTEIDNLPDPFICDECKALGYCKMARAFTARYTNKDRFIPGVNFEIVKQLDRILPLRTTLKSNNKLAKPMQQAHDLLRQQDFESAYLLYRAISSDLYYHWEAYLGLSLCCFYAEEYEEAAYFVNQIDSYDARYYPVTTGQFTDLCERNAAEQVLDIIPSAPETRLAEMAVDINYV